MIMTLMTITTNNNSQEGIRFVMGCPIALVAMPLNGCSAEIPTATTTMRTTTTIIIITIATTIRTTITTITITITTITTKQ